MELLYRGKQYDNYVDLNTAIIKMRFGENIINDDEFNKLRQEIKPYIRKEKDKLKIEMWKNFNTKLKCPTDVPDMDLYEEDYQTYVIPALIRNGAIPKNNLIDGHYYYGQWRAGNFAKWDGETNKFKVWRNKFNRWYLDNANHFEDDDNFALFVPLREITEEQFNNKKI